MAVIEDKNFDSEIKNGVAVVKFVSLWDSSSRVMEDPFRELSDEFRGKARFISSDVQSNPVLANKQGIIKIPSVVIYVNGKPAARMGNVTKRFLKEQLESLLKKSLRLS